MEPKVLQVQISSFQIWQTRHAQEVVLWMKDGILSLDPPAALIHQREARWRYP
jgi:hypothetical protein